MNDATFTREPVALPMTAAFVAEQLRLAVLLADESVISLVENDAVPVFGWPYIGRWYDWRPLVDPREQPPELVDLHGQALSYGRIRGLFTHHAQQPHLLRITRSNRPGKETTS